MSLAKQTLKIYWQHIRRHKFLFWLGVGLVPIAVLTEQFLQPYIVASIFNKLQSQGVPANIWHAFSHQIILFAVLMVIQQTVWRLQVWSVWKFEVRTMRDLFATVFAHLQKQSYRFHNDRFGGALVNQSNKFVYAFERLMDDFVWNIVSGIAAFLFAIIILWGKSPIFTVCLVAVALLHLLIMSKRMRFQAQYNQGESAADSKRTAQLADAITNISSTRSFAHEQFEQKLYAAKATDLYRRSRALMKVALLNEFINSTITNLLGFTALILALVAIVNYHAPIGTLYLIVVYTSGLLRRLWEFGRLMRNLNKSFGDAHDMTAMLSMEPDVKDPPKPRPFKIKRGEIKFENVGFAYHEQTNDPLFINLNLSIESGEKVGLVGHSGGGKTTITKLLLRFMDIQEGQILIDGQNIAEVAQGDLRSKIAYVPQEPLLFHRSLSENIRYGKLESTEREIIEVAKLAHAHDFIEKLPDKYETLVGERGVKLSGGQRQRVAIARALLKDAPILVLDEATSSLDSESEKLIQDALWKLMEGRTAIVIAHRLSTVQKMDRIVVLEEGKIVEQGNHKNLLAKNGIYASLWKHQSGGFLEE